MVKALQTLVRDEDGQGMVEYGLIVALISVAVIGTLTTMKDGVVSVFTKITTQLTTAGG